MKETSDIVIDNESMGKYVKDLNIDELVEFRARIYEREFQVITKQEVDFETFDEMIEFIKDNYNRKK